MLRCTIVPLLFSFRHIFKVTDCNKSTPLAFAVWLGIKHLFCTLPPMTVDASVECVERGLDPLTTNLVVADNSRTEKTICLAVSPSLKNHGVPGRPRLFEVIAKINQVNSRRRWLAPGKKFIGASFDDIVGKLSFLYFSINSKFLFLILESLLSCLIVEITKNEIKTIPKIPKSTKKQIIAILTIS